MNHKGPFPPEPLPPLFGNKTRFLLQKFLAAYATQFCDCGYAKKKKMGKTCSFPHILQFTGASFPGLLAKKRRVLWKIFLPAPPAQAQPLGQLWREKEKPQNTAPNGPRFQVWLLSSIHLVLFIFQSQGVAFCILNII